MKTIRSQFLIISFLVSLLTVLLSPQANATLTDYTDTSAVTFNTLSPPPPEVTLGHFTNADYMWYCGNGVLSCPGDQGPNQAEFRYSLELPSRDEVFGYYQWGEISLLADDYFSLYVNNTLIGYKWLDQAIQDANPKNSDLDPTNDTNNPPLALTFDIGQYLNPGQVNEILIFTCNGNPPNPLVAPGATPDGGWDGCPNSSTRLNNWLLVEGKVQVCPHHGDCFLPETYTFSLNSGELDLDENTIWKVRAVPEPGSLLLLGLGLSILITTHKSRKAQYEAG